MIRTQITRVLWFCFSIIFFRSDVVLSSLLEGTLVATAHGLVPIQSLKAGDKVLGYDLKEPNHEKATREVVVTKIEKHLTDSLFTLCTETGWVEASPHQLIFTLLPETSENKVRVMDFVEAQSITEEYQLIDTQMRCLPIFETNRMELSCTCPQQYAEKKKHGKHKKIKEVSRCKVSVNMYALEVEAPHVFLIGENPYVKDITKTKLLLTHNGIPALAAGVSLVFDATPASLAFGEATASIGGLGVAFGPVGVTLGVITSIGFLGYQLLKSDNQSHQQSQFYIERAGPSNPGGMDPDPNKKKDDKKCDKPIVIRGKGMAPKEGTPFSIYEKVDNEDPNLVISRTTYNKFGKTGEREDYFIGSNRHTHFNDKTKTELQSHKHIFEYNEKGLPIGRGFVVPLE
jgi:hypothetical protein